MVLIMQKPSICNILTFFKWERERELGIWFSLKQKKWQNYYNLVVVLDGCYLSNSFIGVHSEKFT